jgi:hypothetical protein
MLATAWAALAVLPALAAASVAGSFAGASGIEFRKKQLARLQQHAARAHAADDAPVVDVRDVDAKKPPFYNRNSAPFYVDGTKIPNGVSLCSTLVCVLMFASHLRCRAIILGPAAYLGREE